MKSMKNKLCIILICFFVFAITANIYGETKKNDVRPGMSIDKAVLVARNCVYAASGIEKSKILISDTLDFLGVNNELRLDALRNHIVRNTEIGVQSVWIYHDTRKLSQHFIISNSSLAKIDKSWTVEKLARTISTSAGLPNLTYEKAAKIIADSRFCAVRGNHVSPSYCEPSRKKDEKIPPIKISTVIRDDPDLAGGKIDRFIDILSKNDKAGIKSAGITDATGNSYSYLFSNSILETEILKKGINDCGWSYGQLINFIYKYAEVPLSPDLTATQLVLNAILYLLPQRNKGEKAAEIENTKNTVFTFSEFLGESLKIKESYTLEDLGISRDQMRQKLIELTSPVKIEICREVEFKSSLQTYSRDNKSVAVRQVEDIEFPVIEKDTNIGELIKITTKVLKAQVAQTQKEAK